MENRIKKFLPEPDKNKEPVAPDEKELKANICPNMAIPLSESNFFMAARVFGFKDSRGEINFNMHGAGSDMSDILSAMVGKYVHSVKQQRFINSDLIIQALINKVHAWIKRADKGEI